MADDVASPTSRSAFTGAREAIVRTNTPRKTFPCPAEICFVMRVFMLPLSSDYQLVTLSLLAPALAFNLGLTAPSGPSDHTITVVFTR